MTSVFWTSTSTATEASARASASTANTAWKKVPPLPPWRSGISMPITPRSKSLGTRSGGNAASSSMARERGPTSRVANSRTESNSSRSSSVNRVSGGVVEAVSGTNLLEFSTFSSSRFLLRRIVSSRHRLSTPGGRLNHRIINVSSPMSITPFRLAGAVLIAGALATASVGARVQQTTKPTTPDTPPPAEQPPSDPGKQPPAKGQAGQPTPQTQQEGAPTADQQQRPTFRTDINFVRVDVIVTDKKGEPVTDLSQKDFQVWEDGEPQDVESFKLFKIDALTQTTPARPIRSLFDEESEAQREDVRLFAFFLDDYHVRRGNAMRSRIALANFV